MWSLTLYEYAVIIKEGGHDCSNAIYYKEDKIGSEVCLLNKCICEVIYCEIHIHSWPVFFSLKNK
jgi:hypothetical protein